ncbi:hypothetical protein [Pseudonocardia nigra]|uniref:hypothetical protein n=1 Tax=Pseudonocardia nigra TaxID=1921578 RepID=UPI001C5FD8E0|nr:hypothetical protein [Pseudonocardia nigra]
MTTESARGDSPEEEDRVVSRRVDNPTTATEEDEGAYDAADPLPDGGVGDSYRGATGGVSEHYVEPNADSEPTRSE